jgi:hypothetical protein
MSSLAFGGHRCMAVDDANGVITSTELMVVGSPPRRFHGRSLITNPLTKRGSDHIRALTPRIAIPPLRRWERTTVPWNRDRPSRLRRSPPIDSDSPTGAPCETAGSSRLAQSRSRAMRAWRAPGARWPLFHVTSCKGLASASDSPVPRHAPDRRGWSRTRCLDGHAP